MLTFSLLFLTILTSVIVQWGVETSFSLNEDEVYFSTTMPSDVESPFIIVRLDKSISVQYDYIYGDYVTVYNYENQEQKSASGKTQYIQLRKYNGLVSVKIDTYYGPASGTIIFTDSLNIPMIRGYIVSAICFLVLVIILSIGCIIRCCLPKIDTDSKYRHYFLVNSICLLNGFLYVLGSAFTIVGTFFIGEFQWMLILGVVFLALFPFSVYFTKLELDSSEFRVTRFLVGCIPWTQRYPVSEIENFVTHINQTTYYGAYNGTDTTFVVKLHRKGEIITSIEGGFISFLLEDRTIAVYKLNQLLSKINNIGTVSETPKQAVAPVEIPMTHVNPTPMTPANPSPPPYNQVVPPQPYVPSTLITAQYMQALVAPLSTEDKGKVMALYYIRPGVVEACARDITDPNLLRTTLLAVANKPNL